jgi:hypothetical protein
MSAAQREAPDGQSASVHPLQRSRESERRSPVVPLPPGADPRAGLAIAAAVVSVVECQSGDAGSRKATRDSAKEPSPRSRTHEKPDPITTHGDGPFGVEGS